jgi:hypothetical protein
MSEEFSLFVEQAFEERISTFLRRWDPDALPVHSFPLFKAECVNMNHVMDSDAYRLISSVWYYDEQRKTLRQSSLHLDDEIPAIYHNIHYTLSINDGASSVAWDLQNSKDLEDLFKLYINSRINPLNKATWGTYSPARKLQIVQDKILKWSKNRPLDSEILNVSDEQDLFAMFPGASSSLKRSLLLQYVKCARSNPYEIAKLWRQGFLSLIQKEGKPKTKLSDDTDGFHFVVDRLNMTSEVKKLLNRNEVVEVSISFTKPNDFDFSGYLNYDHNGTSKQVHCSQLVSSPAVFNVDFSQVKVTFSFKGFAHYDITPAPFRAGLFPEGWLAASVITAAADNRNSAEGQSTGYHFVTDEYNSMKFGELGEFGLCGKVFLSSSPDISVSYIAEPNSETINSHLEILKNLDGISFFGNFPVHAKPNINYETSTVTYLSTPFDNNRNPYARMLGILPIWPGGSQAT